MQYLFKIYQAKDIVGYNKYKLSDYNYLQNITQNSQWGLKKERDGEFWTVVRVNFNGKITVDGADYTFLKGLEGTVEQLAIVIEQRHEGAWKVLWKGFFTWHDFDVDEDRCTLSFEPKPWDDYTPIYDRMENSVNVLEVEDTYDLVATFPSYDTEAYQINYELGAVGPPTWVKLTGEYALHTRYTHYYINPNDFADYWWAVTDIYMREVTYAATGVTPPGPDWVDLSEEVSPGIWKWARPIYDSSLGTATYTHTNHNLNDTWILDGSGDTITWQFFRCRKLVDVLQYFCLLYGQTFASDFFSSVNPLSTLGFPLPRLDWTFIEQISEVGMHFDAATRGLLSLRDLLSWIRDTWDAFWYIDPNGDFRIEHRRYFLYGESYTVPKTVGLDLTALAYADCVRNMNRYKWEKENLYRYEIWQMNSSANLDWTCGKMRYPQQSLLEDKEKKFTPGWCSDLLYLYEEKKNLGKDGWVVLMGDYYSSQWAVLEALGAYTGKSYPNMDLAPGCINWWKYWSEDRLFLTAEWDELQLSMAWDSALRMKVQDEIQIPDCAFEIDYNKLARTELGDGLIQQGEWDAKTGNHKIQIKYA